MHPRVRHHHDPMYMWHATTGVVSVERWRSFVHPTKNYRGVMFDADRRVVICDSSDNGWDNPVEYPSVRVAVAVLALSS